MRVLIEIPDEEIPEKNGFIDMSLQFLDGKIVECDFPFEMTGKICKKIKSEISKNTCGISTNIEEPYDVHEMVFVDDVYKIVDKYLLEKKI